MNLLKTLIATAAAVASLGANATLAVSTTATSGTFLTLAGAGTPNSGGTLSDGATLVATIADGAVVTGSFSNVSAQPMGAIPPYLTVSPVNGTPATMTFLTGTDFLSFIWGSPDTFNTLTVTTNSSTYTFVPGSTPAISFLSTDGDQGYSQYVAFTTSGGELIKSLQFESTQNAFETANYSITAAVPEPETYALMLGGLGVLGFVARRRKPV